MKTPEEKEHLKRIKTRRERLIFYGGMFSGMVLTFLMLLLNRL